MFDKAQHKGKLKNIGLGESVKASDLKVLRCSGGNVVFRMAQIYKMVPGILSQSGEPEQMVIPIVICDKCGKIAPGQEGIGNIPPEDISRCTVNGYENPPKVEGFQAIQPEGIHKA